MNRRDFLKWMGLAGLGLTAGLAGSGCWKPKTEPGAKGAFAHVQLPEWTGDSFGPMHRIRDGMALETLPKPSRTVEVAIIGGGLTGLTAAHQLRDSDFLLLEREAQLGGNAKSGDYQGIQYALGSAYLVDVEEPYGPLYESLGLTLQPIREPTDNAYLMGRWNPLNQGPVQQGFEKLRKHLAQLLQSQDFPGVPIELASTEALKLDKISFYDYLKTDYPPDLLHCIDAYCYSALGGSIREISAYAGINFYSEIAGSIYAFPGGNAAVAQRLVSAIEKAGPNRMMTDVSVAKVIQRDHAVDIVYFSNAQPEELITVRAKQAILAVPFFFARRILAGLPDSQDAILHGVRYGSYLVANFCFDRPVFNGAYDNWSPHNPAFTDFIDAGYVSHDQAPGQVLTVYAPFRNAQVGRSKLLLGNRKALASDLITQLQAIAPFKMQLLKEIRLTRYGHQLMTSRVGQVSELRSLNKNMGRVILAHSDGQGMAAIESAIWEGLQAAQNLKRR